MEAKEVVVYQVTRPVEVYCFVVKRNAGSRRGRLSESRKRTCWKDDYIN
jgi:hypothetical protein